MLTRCMHLAPPTESRLGIPPPNPSKSSGVLLFLLNFEAVAGEKASFAEAGHGRVRVQVSSTV